MHKQLCSARAVRKPTASQRIAQEVERRDPEVTAGFFFSRRTLLALQTLQDSMNKNVGGLKTQAGVESPEELLLYYGTVA